MHGTMKENPKAPTHRMIPILAQTVQHYQTRYKIQELASGESRPESSPILGSRTCRFSAKSHTRFRSTSSLTYLRYSLGSYVAYVVSRLCNSRRSPTPTERKTTVWCSSYFGSHTRFSAVIKNAIWYKRSLEAVGNFYCITPGDKCGNSDV